MHHIGYVVRETPDKIVIFGYGKDRWDIPITETQTVSKNVLIGLRYSSSIRKICRPLEK
jgi:hypothetical protein